MNLHDAHIDKPRVNIEGISDPVVLFTSNNMVLVGWWDANRRCWNCIEYGRYGIEKETFGNVMFWHEIKFPNGWTYDEGVYS